MLRNTTKIICMVMVLLAMNIIPAYSASREPTEALDFPAPATQTGNIDKIEVLVDGTTIRTVIPASVSRSSRSVGDGTNQLIGPSWLDAEIPSGLTFLNGVAIQVSFGVDKHVLPEPAFFEITFAQPEIGQGLKILHWENHGWKEMAVDSLKVKTQLLGDYVLATDVIPTSTGAGESFILNDGTQVVVSIPDGALSSGNQNIVTAASLVKKEKIPGKLPEGQNLIFLNAVYVGVSADGNALDILPGDSLVNVTFAKNKNQANSRILHWQEGTWKELAYAKLQVVSKHTGSFVLVYQK